MKGLRAITVLISRPLEIGKKYNSEVILSVALTVLEIVGLPPELYRIDSRGGRQTLIYGNSDRPVGRCSGTERYST